LPAAQVPGIGQLSLAYAVFTCSGIACSVSSYLIRLRLWRSSWGEPDAVGGVADVEVEHGPGERQAAGLAGEAADHLGAALDLAEGPFERVRRSLAPAVSGRVAQVHDERVEVVAEASGGGGVAGPIELVDQRLESLVAVALVGGVIERLPVGPTDAFALALG
jgi:hypothetical protein